MKKLTLIAALLLAGCATRQPTTSTSLTGVQMPDAAVQNAQRHTDAMLEETTQYMMATDKADLTHKRGETAQKAFNHFLEVYHQGQKVRAAGKTPAEAQQFSQLLAQKMTTAVKPQKAEDAAILHVVTAHSSAALLDGYYGK